MFLILILIVSTINNGLTKDNNRSNRSSSRWNWCNCWCSTSDVEPPQTPDEDKKEVECPPINARRIGDRSQKGDEQVKEYKLTPDGLVCELIWEPVPTVEQFVPTAGQASTTLAVAVIATAGATATPILLRIIKPVIKKISDTIKKKLGKGIKRPSISDKKTDEYRAKKGLPPIKRK